MRLRERMLAAGLGAEVELDPVLLAAWNADMRWAWWTAMRKNVDVVLAVRPDVSGAESAERSWRRRMAFWVPIQAARVLRNRLRGC
jgi:hypothetical protein